MGIVGISVDDAGERDLFLLTSARFGGDGVPVQRGGEVVRRMKNTVSGALLCVNDKLVGLQPGKVMTELHSQDARSKAWKRLMDVLDMNL